MSAFSQLTSDLLMPTVVDFYGEPAIHTVSSGSRQAGLLVTVTDRELGTVGDRWKDGLAKAEEFKKTPVKGDTIELKDRDEEYTVIDAKVTDGWLHMTLEEKD